MPERTSTVSITLNGDEIQVPDGAIVAAVILNAQAYPHSLVTGEPRAPLCGMGICFECRATVNGRPYQRTCQIVCEDGMDVRTQ
ncbi:(2Fe-2S)-binding protein [Alloacidobacterium sp.]|uniref:(2Fe-2S)-binding protein n=1 Tax=Alloacidobacterium sp. TaxID=2951999 RepID=UPI002D598111|nr:(2Fe-2S)-binding protein [Alloacidobacterium sp.]HYK35752.1 (2Fe-2S)-binding protein [Alloacidobacterium sp.]